MDDEVVTGEVLGKVASGYHIYLQVLADTLPQQTGNLHPPDIFRQGSMGTGFGYQYARLLRQTADGRRSFHKKSISPL